MGTADHYCPLATVSFYISCIFQIWLPGIIRLRAVPASIISSLDENYCTTNRGWKCPLRQSKVIIILKVEVVSASKVRVCMPVCPGQFFWKEKEYILHISIKTIYANQNPMIFQLLLEKPFPIYSHQFKIKPEPFHVIFDFVSLCELHKKFQNKDKSLGSSNWWCTCIYSNYSFSF